MADLSLNEESGSQSRGFTLIELLVVIAIIGLLSAIVLASLNTARTKGQDAARIADVKSLKTAMELYYNTNNGYPTSAGSSNGDVSLGDATLVSKLVPTYMPSMPAVLISDGDHYYAGGATSGVGSIYGLYIITAAAGGPCLTGVGYQNSGWWNLDSSKYCNF